MNFSPESLRELANTNEALGMGGEGTNADAMRWAADELERLRHGIAEVETEIVNLLAPLWPDEFPEYPEDWPEGTEVRCVGEHTSVTLVMKAQGEIERLRTGIEDFLRGIDEAPSVIATGPYWKALRELIQQNDD